MRKKSIVEVFILLFVFLSCLLIEIGAIIQCVVSENIHISPTEGFVG